MVALSGRPFARRRLARCHAFAAAAEGGDDRLLSPHSHDGHQRNARAKDVFPGVKTVNSLLRGVRLPFVPAREKEICTFLGTVVARNLKNSFVMRAAIFTCLPVGGTLA